jgi:hypothetical protein
MEWGRVVVTELMPSLVGGDAETVCGKLKKGKRFLKPNLGALPNSVPTLNGVGQLLEVLDLNIIDCRT